MGFFHGGICILRIFLEFFFFDLRGGGDIVICFELVGIGEGIDFGGGEG